MRHICLIVDSIFSIGGVQRVTAVIAKELAKNYDVTIMTFDKPEIEDTTLYDLNKASIKYRYIKYPKTNTFKRKICKIYSGLYIKLRPQMKWCSDLYAKSSFPSELRHYLTKELKKENFDTIIGVHAPLAARLATIRNSFPNTKLIGWIHNSYEALFSDESLYIGSERKRHYVYQFKKLDEVVVLCHHDADLYHLYDHNFSPTVIYNPLTLEPGFISKGESKRFLAVGRFSKKHKGFDLLIEAFHLFAENNNEWKLDIVGEGIEEALYKQLIKKYHLEERVLIHPFTKDIQKYYTEAQIYVLSSRWEGFGLVLVEAMAHGLPVVSSDLPTSLEIMGNFGIYFRNGDFADLALKLEEATRIDWNKEAENALAIAQKFDIKSITSQWEKLIEKEN
jgi:glycosyltransferase involved in cell wall biosynthesis